MRKGILLAVSLTEAILDSWDRQCRIVAAVASRIDASNRHLKPSEDGWPLDYHLAHMHHVRKEWLTKVNPERGSRLGNAFTAEWENPIEDLDAIRERLQESGRAVRDAVRDALAAGTGAVGGYDHPILFLQHMVWHDGWHVGLLFLGLRLAGQEPPPEWEEENVWGEWRTEEW
jgi:uncharacterized damage-inducible protein DinB